MAWHIAAGLNEPLKSVIPYAGRDYLVTWDSQETVLTPDDRLMLVSIARKTILKKEPLRFVNNPFDAVTIDEVLISPIKKEF